MALPGTEDIEQGSEDIQALALAQSYFVLSESAAWKDLMGRVQALVDQAQQELFSDMSPEANQIVLLKTRWQQRLMTQQAMFAIVKSQLDARTNILEEMKESTNEHYTDNA
jgi:hypothetical protein